MNHAAPNAPAAAPGQPPGSAEIPFGVNEVRLNRRQWLATFMVVLAFVLFTPSVWERIERFDTGSDYRIPYSLSADYWLYGRRLRQVADQARIILLGDSVVWGEYVLPDGTLSHFLNREAAATDRFVNGGVNGLFPLALEGLTRHYGQSLRGQKVIVQCNLLWMTSPKADLSTDKEEQLNHARLVPQFSPRIPCYRADANERLTALVERNVPFLSWANHLQNAYFEQKSIPKWTLQDDGTDPPHYPNAYKNPLAQITLAVPAAPDEDPQRGPRSPRHKPWSTNNTGTTRFDWVELDASLQWAAFQRTVKLLEHRGNHVLVILGPFNEHMMAEENRAACRKRREAIAAWLVANRIDHVVPETLSSALYADASHPLTEGYELLAKQIYQHDAFQRWLKKW
jgi:hypothetical protein